ncbi:uncharacterized protein LOC116430091 [Nomia melanderi]|uniref:uncharacterized protein LOC116430091 n=1 Tax=Nomia melanderi TaxID=2448451 RepID=UPI0013042615|nr:uncharacterized protein LOC116430091 [Nomia melanderi]
MRSKTFVLFFIGIASVSNLEGCYGLSYDRPEIVTYGEPCAPGRQLPITVEGPKPPVETQKIPLSLNFKVATDMSAKPRRLEYPIAIDVPVPKLSPMERTIVEEDALRGKSYAYDTYVPPANHAIPLPRNYNFAVNLPVSIEKVVPEKPTERFVKRLTGLATRVDRVLVPACELSSSSRC